MTASGLNLEVVDSPEAIACLTDPVRQRILRALRQEGSASSISRTLNQPRQKLAYHIKKLEQAGLLKHIRDQKKGNCTERILKATATRYLLAPNAVGSDLSTDELQDRLSANALLALAAGCIDEVCQVQQAAGHKRISTISLDTEVGFCDQEEKAAFAEALARSFTEVAARFPVREDVPQQRFKLIIGAYPKLPESDHEQLESNHE